MVSRQYLDQLKRNERGICRFCAQKVISSGMCEKHYRRKLEKKRARAGIKNPTGSKVLGEKTNKQYCTVAVRYKRVGALKALDEVIEFLLVTGPFIGFTVRQIAEHVKELRAEWSEK